MRWISFETPSVRDFRVVELRIRQTPVFSAWKSDYLKLIKNRDWKLLWVLNKLTNKYIFLEDWIEENIKQSIIKIIRLADTRCGTI